MKTRTSRFSYIYGFPFAFGFLSAGDDRYGFSDFVSLAGGWRFALLWGAEACVVCMV